MGLSRTEWRDVAEVEAARSYGKKYAGWFAFKRFGAGPLGIVVVVAALGLGARWVWTHVRSLLAGTDVAVSGGHTLAVAFIVLTLATFIAYRPGRSPSMPVALVVKLLVFGALWLGLFAFLIGRIL